ncbi:MAG TPA: MBL fold metallo-hydrolase [Miltoncostaeaceae bacterium]|nr:MBL fold metallo-hydrolase [Miltoncostaeaceae bacterium]
MSETGTPITVIDTHLAGRERLTACYLLLGERPAIIDPGAETSTQTVVDALGAAGLGPDDLAWIVLTHIHLDHCGATGGIAAAFPKATVVVHPRGARHLAEPDRLVAATAAVHGPRASLYGGLRPTAPERITVAEDGHMVDLGGGRRLEMFETVGHARHHMAVHDEATDSVFAGDAVGVTFPGGGPYPAMPPSDIDLEGWRHSLDRISDRRPRALYPTHFGPVPDPQQTIATVREQLATTARAARAAWRGGGGVSAVAEALDHDLPLAPAVRDPAALAQWEFIGWREANPDGVAAWARSREERDES